MAIKQGDRLTLHFKDQTAYASVVSVDVIDSGAYIPNDQIETEAEMTTRRIIVRLDNDPTQEYEEVLPLSDEGWQRYKLYDLEISLNHRLVHRNELPNENPVEIAKEKIEQDAVKIRSANQ